MKLKDMIVQVSDGNTKLGKIAAVSLSPLVTCNPLAPCTRRKGADCYACQAQDRSKQAKAAWKRNTEIARKDLTRFFSEIQFYWQMKGTEFFRWEVSGDFPSPAYLEGMKELHRRNPGVKGLAFTKRVGKGCEDYDYSDLPDNLTIISSQWPGFESDPSSPLPRSWVDNPKQLDNRIPKNAVRCPGSCITCGMCWQLGKGSLKSVRDVVLPFHGRTASKGNKH